MFRDRVATKLLAAGLAPFALGAGAAGASFHQDRQISIETRFLEVDPSFVQEIGVGFRSLTAEPGSPFVGGLAAETLSALLSSGQATILAAPRISVVPDYSGTIEVGGTLSVPSRIPGSDVTFDDFGIRLNFTPQIRPDGNIGLDLNLASDELDLGSTVPQVKTKRTGADLVLPLGETVVIGGLLSDDLRGQANRVPGLGRLPVLGSLFRNTGQAAAKTLVVLVTPVLLDEDGQPIGGAAGWAPLPSAPVATPAGLGPALLGLKPGQHYVGFGAGVIYQYMPTFNWLQLQASPDLSFVSEDTDIVAPQFVFDGGIGLDQGLFGGTSRLALSLSYFDSDTNRFEDSLSAAGSDLNIELPDGGLTTVPGADSDLENVFFQFSYRALDLNLKVYEEVPAGGKGLTFGAGLALRYDRSETSLSFLTNNQSDQYERRDKVKNWSVGPVIRAYLSHDYGPLTAYGGAEFRGLASIADGSTEVDLNSGSQGNLDLSKTRFTYDLSLKAGARFDVEPFKIDLQTTFGYGNNHPVIVYRQGDPAELAFKASQSWAARASVIYPFD